MKLKLGLVIDTTDDGLGKAKGINEEESWTQYIVDVRTAIKRLQHFDGIEKNICLVKFLGDKGYLLALIKSRPEGSGRDNDNVAVWIHVPAKCNISSTKTIEILKGVKYAISKGTEKGTKLLDKIFNEEYDPNEVLLSALDSIVSKEEGDYAVRFYGGETTFSLEELLGKNIAQQEYREYRGIIFIDKESGITANWKELTFEPKKIYTLLQPTPTDDFKAYLKVLGKDVLFDKPIEVLEKTMITVVWKKSGYSDITKHFKAYESDTSRSSLTINSDEYCRIIKRSDFHISAEDGTQIKDFNVHINDTILKDYRGIPESEFNNVNMKISAEGYEDCISSNFNLASNKNFKLKKKLYHYVFVFPEYAPKNSKEEAVLTIKTYQKLSKSPIKGYSLVNKIQEGENINHLYCDHGIKYKLKYIGIGIISCLLAIMLYASWQVMGNYEFKLGWPQFKEVKKSDEPLSTEEENTEPAISENTDSINAVAYLEKSPIWHKDSLNKYESTRGLFEELNEFKSDKIEKRTEILGNIERLNSIIQAFKENDFDHHIGKEKNNGKYNSDTDKGIAINNYIRWISVEHKPERTEKPQNIPPTTSGKITSDNVNSGNQGDTHPISNKNDKKKRGSV